MINDKCPVGVIYHRARPRAISPIIPEPCLCEGKVHRDPDIPFTVEEWLVLENPAQAGAYTVS